MDAAPIDGAATALPADAPAAPPAEGDAGAASIGEPFDARPRFRRRTQMRRRLRYLRRLRELAFRDLGGLVFDLHRFGRERADLVAGKLDALAVIDGELRTLERALGDVQEVTELREPGIAACPHCQTLHDTSARFCPGCGTALQGRAAKQAGEPAAGTQEPTGGTQEGAAEPPAAAPAESAPSEQQPTATSS